MASPAVTCRAEAARDSIRAWYQALRQPRDVAGRVRNATLSIVVGHVGDRPERPSASCDRTSHGCIGVLDVEIVRSTRWLEAPPGLADHDRGIAKPYMGVAHTPLLWVTASVVMGSAQCAQAGRSRRLLTRGEPVQYPQGFESGVSMPGLGLLSGSGTEIGVTLTLATPLSCVIPIISAVDSERSTIRT